MIKLAFGEFDGDSWEELSQKCFKLKYADQKYQRIPADSGGDLGIEGFTRDGLVFQCYCPDQAYSPAEMYKHQRKKITDDLKKLIRNKDKLMKDYLGDITIKTWYFVTPYINNKSIIEHCNKKKLEIKKLKLDHLDNNFDILILESDDLLREINYLVRIDNSYKLNYKVDIIKDDADWSQCPSELIQNLVRKITAVVPDPESSESKNTINRLVEIYADYYTKGYKLLNILQSKHLDMYENLISIKSTYETDVEVKCLMNRSNVDSNRTLFFDIINDFEKKLTNEFGELFATEMIEVLKNQIISGWLLECPMNFR